MSECDYENCKRSSNSVCMIADLEGEVFHQGFCIYHLKKMLAKVPEEHKSLEY